LNENGTINRRLLGDIVFVNAERRQVLNNIVHPPVRAMWQEGLALRHPSIKVVAIPLLFEVGVEKNLIV